MNDLEEKKRGLWANIHAKRKRGEKMRRPGEKGAPTDADFKSAQEAAIPDSPRRREEGTDSLANTYKKATPGQTIKRVVREQIEIVRGLIKEELNSEQKKKVSTWKRDPTAASKTDHYFGAGNDEKIEELGGSSNKSEPHSAIESHLNQNISHEDYKQGYTNDRYGRRVKIGALLQKSKAPTELINSFANDSTRQLKKQTGLHVQVTRSAAGVAGQTSGGQSWENESCKNFSNGSNKSYLKHEVQHGTVVSYLRNHHGHELARITFQPHHDENGNVIYKRNSYYGPRVKEFEQHANELESKLSQPNAPKNSVYSIHSKVYNDSNFSQSLHPDLKSEDLDQYFSHKDENIRKSAANHPNATSEQLHKALNDKKYDVRVVALRSSNITSEHLDKALNDKFSAFRRIAASHPNATSKHLDKALNDKESSVRSAAAEHPRANSDNLHKALNDKDSSVRFAAVRHPRANSEHLHKALNDSSDLVRAAAASHPNATPEHLDKALNDKDFSVRNSVVNHPNASLKHLQSLSNDESPLIKTKALKRLKALKKVKGINESVYKINGKRLLEIIKYKTIS